MPFNRQRISVSLACYRIRTLGARTDPLIPVSTVFAENVVVVVTVVPLAVSTVHSKDNYGTALEKDRR